ncbi:hypothetical protein [Janthinobacterium sp.]|uniref:hypothetical protein n=1 Tax=Janthinobacterium sp. TaxID=1871054 RepID=UPI003977CD7B
MVSLTSVNNVQTSIALSQRLVQQDQSQVQQDNARLAQSQVQLGRDQEQLSQARRQERQAGQSAALAAPRTDGAIAVPSQKPLPAALAQPQRNTQGQTIGSLINVTA